MSQQHPHAHGNHEPHQGHGKHPEHHQDQEHKDHQEHQAPHEEPDPHAGHAGHATHTGHTGHTPGGLASWSVAAKATLHCLTGCAIGEVLGMVIGTSLGWGNAPTMALAITLAFLFGYSFTLGAVLRAGLSFRTAVKVALIADTLSITVMEIVDNGVLLLTPGTMDAHLDDGLFWGALAFAFAVAFLVTTPVNRWLIGRGKGHAVVHQYH